jgi:hypothetical protein
MENALSEQRESKGPLAHRRLAGPSGELRLGKPQSGEGWPAMPIDFHRESDYPDDVSPTVLRARGFRFYFFSREEVRPHVHVQHAEGEAKFW